MFGAFLQKCKFWVHAPFCFILFFFFASNIRRKNFEGTELFDCSGDELEIDKTEEELENLEDIEEPDNDTETEVDITPHPSTAISLENLCEDQDINNDAKFLDDFQVLLENQNSSKLLTPFISQLKVINKKARRSVKKRINLHQKRNTPVNNSDQEISTNMPDDINVGIQDEEEDEEMDALFDLEDEQENEEETVKPKGMFTNFL